MSQEVMLTADNTTLDPGERRVVYRAAELVDLRGLDDQILQLVHNTKKAFHATLRAN